MENHPEEQEPEPEPKSLMIYGRNVAEIPCFRNSFLYGGGAYFAGGLGTFLLTSRPSFSSHIGMTAFVCTTIGFWFHCRYNYSKLKFAYSQLTPAMRKQAIYEGTSMESEAEKRAEEA